jgi:hypothetical protein
MISTWEFKAQIDALSSYLNFSNGNWKQYEQTMDEEIKEEIDVLRHKFGGYQDLSDEEILSNVYERQWLQHEFWDIVDSGMELDFEFRLELEEYHLLSSREMKSEFLKGKPFFYASFVMMTYSFIERHLIEICFHIQTEDGLLFSDKRLKGKGVQRASLFLEKMMGYKIDESTWEELMLVRRLRNNLVHLGYDVGVHQGEDLEKLYENGISNLDQDLVEYLTKWKVFRLPSIILDFEYCLHLVEFTQKLFEKLINDLRVKDPNLFL